MAFAVGQKGESMDDLISRQAAIDVTAYASFSVTISGKRGFQNYKEEFEKACVAIRDKYIEALKALPAVQPEPCEDAVSRSEIIRLILERGLYCDTQADRETSAEIIRQFPSVQPEIIRCGECKYWETTWQNDWAPNYHYCPNVDGVRRNDFYCADAERSTDGKE